MVARVLTIAGSDSGGGAGIQADLKTITMMGGYGMSALAALTAQNTVQVAGIHEVPLEFIALQMDVVLEDIGVDAAKTGMLLNSRVVRLVADKVREHGIPNLVVDPVMAAKSGDALLLEEARQAIKTRLLPLSTVCTPNIPEAEILSGHSIRTHQDMKDAARMIHDLGAQHVLVKGGHRLDRPVDLLFDGLDFFEFEGIRYDTPNTHGTGCTFSAAIATALAQGFSVPEAVSLAKIYTDLAIRFSLDIGEGHGPTNHYAPMLVLQAQKDVLGALEQALELLQDLNLGFLIPETNSSLVYALPKARTREDVAGFPGRVVRYYESVGTVGPPDFGVSEDAADLILAVCEYFPEQRCAMNLRRVSGLDDGAYRMGLQAVPLEGLPGTESWKTSLDRLLDSLDRAPEILFLESSSHRDSQVMILGPDPVFVAETIAGLVDFLQERSPE